MYIEEACCLELAIVVNAWFYTCVLCNIRNPILKADSKLPKKKQCSWYY